MEKELMIRGFYRLNKLLINMINCEDKQETIRLSSCFMDDVQELISLIYVEKNIDDEDIEQFRQSLVDLEKESMQELEDNKEPATDDPIEPDATALQEDQKD